MQNDVSTQITYIVDGIKLLVLRIIDISFIFINWQNHNISCIFSISFLGCLVSTSGIQNQEEFCIKCEPLELWQGSKILYFFI